jgi:DNA-directed RNA polymerase subunit M/transcription elongation factor TFIIS
MKTIYDRNCKECNAIFVPYKTTDKFCYLCSKTKLALKNLEKIKKEKVKKQKEDLLTLQDYLKLAQQVFNKWIRLRDEGLVCISCQIPMRQGNIDAGHLWSAGGHSNVRFNELNVNAQCSRPCNKDKAGDINNYRLGFVKRYSVEQLDELDKIANVTRKWTKDELKKLIAEYKEKIKNI